MEKEGKCLFRNRKGKSRLRGWPFGTDFGDYRNGREGTEIGDTEMRRTLKNRTQRIDAPCASTGKVEIWVDEAAEISKEAWESLKTMDSSKAQHFVFPQPVRLNAGRSRRPC